MTYHPTKQKMSKVCLIMQQICEMQIWLIQRYTNSDLKKGYPKNFTFLILRILELFGREVWKLLKK